MKCLKRIQMERVSTFQKKFSQQTWKKGRIEGWGWIYQTLLPPMDVTSSPINLNLWNTSHYNTNFKQCDKFSMVSLGSRPDIKFSSESLPFYIVMAIIYEVGQDLCGQTFQVFYSTKKKTHTHTYTHNE